MKRIRKNEKNKKTKNEEPNLLQIMDGQAKRIAELKQENCDLLLTLESYRMKEKEIAETLVFAKKKSEELVDDAKIRHALECERLKLYRSKWTRQVGEFLNSERLRADFERTYNVLRECQLEMERMVSEDLGEDIASFIEERDRLMDEPVLDYAEIIKQTLKKSEPVKKEELIEELSDPELEDLLKQL